MKIRYLVTHYDWEEIHSKICYACDKREVAEFWYSSLKNHSSFRVIYEN